jgi:hypothetical protein
MNGAHAAPWLTIKRRTTITITIAAGTKIIRLFLLNKNLIASEKMSTFSLTKFLEEKGLYSAKSLIPLA